MVECVGHGVALCLLLQVVVANLRCHVDALLDVALFERAKHPVVMVGPYTGEEVGLELQTYADAVALLLAHTAHLLMGVVEYSQQILHMVSHLVCNDVGIGKVAIGTQLSLHLCEEGEVDVYALVGRAVEGPRRSRSSTAARLYATGEEYQLKNIGIS